MGEWRTIFFIAAAFYFTGNLIFIIFGKAEIQPWNEVNENIKTSAIRDAHEEDDEKLGEVSMTWILLRDDLFYIKCL